MLGKSVMTVLPICFEKDDKIAIIAPHPDDECIGVGGVMAKYASQCDVFVVTDGRQGNISVSSEKEAEIRRKQFEEEMKLAEVNSFFWLGYEDGMLTRHGKNIFQNIDFSSYTKIFIPWEDDNHPDHAAVCYFAVNYLKDLNVMADVYQYEVHVPFHDVSHYVDITDVMDKKRTFISCHKDQMVSLPYVDIACALGKYRACQGGDKESYWETFKKIDIQKESEIDELIEREKTLQKYQAFYRLLLRWIKNYQDGNEITKLLVEKDWKNISIYGFSELGKLFYREIDKTKINVIDILDVRALSNRLEGTRALIPENGDIEVDVVIVTAITYYDEIEAKLNKLGYKNIVSLQALFDIS